MNWNWNKILAVIIILTMLLAFCAWLLISMVALTASPLQSLKVIVPGLLVFGFWFAVSFRLYYSRYEEY